MGSMDDVLARIRAAGTAPALKAPRTEKEILAAMAAAGRAEMARSGAAVVAPPAPELDYEPTVDIRMPLLPVTLTPYEAMPLDLTREEVQQQMSLGPDDYESDESYANDVERHWQRELVRRGAVGTRAAAALGVYVDQGPMAAIVCSACAAPDPAMMCDVTLHEIRARCAAGCTTEALGRGIGVRVTEHERYHRAAAQNEATSALASKVSITAFKATTKINWVIPGFVAANGLTVLGGESGDGKTFAAMYTGIAVALGQEWFDRQTTQTRALLLLLEGTADDHGRRLSLLAAGMGATLDDLDGKLDVYPAGDGFEADDPAAMQRLVDLVTTLGHKFVVIDNLTTARSNSDENSVANLGAALKPLADLAHTHGVGILLIHHFNAHGNLRGSTAIKQHADAVFEIRRSNPNNMSPVSMTRTKDRYGASFEKLRYRFVDRFDMHGAPTAIVATAIGDHRPDPADLVPAKVVVDMNAPPPPPEDIPVTAKFADLLNCLPCSSAHIYKAVGGSRTKVKQIRDQLERHGKIILKGTEWHKV